MVRLGKNGIVGNTSVTLDGKVVGTADLERTKSGYVIAHIDVNETGAEILTKGFSLGSFSLEEREQ